MTNSTKDFKDDGVNYNNLSRAECMQLFVMYKSTNENLDSVKLTLKVTLFSIYVACVAILVSLEQVRDEKLDLAMHKRTEELSIIRAKLEVQGEILKLSDSQEQTEMVSIIDWSEKNKREKQNDISNQSEKDNDLIESAKSNLLKEHIATKNKENTVLSKIKQIELAHDVFDEFDWYTYIGLVVLFFCFYGFVTHRLNVNKIKRDSKIEALAGYIESKSDSKAQ